MEILEKQSDEQQFSLRRNVLCRIEELFASARSKYPSVGSFILVVDSESLKIISSAAKMSDLLKMGVASIEKLELLRKDHPKLHAVYILSPTSESVNALISDFPDESLSEATAKKKAQLLEKKKKKKQEKEKKKKKKKSKKKGDNSDDDEADSDDEIIEQDAVSAAAAAASATEEKDKQKEVATSMYHRIHVYFTSALPKTLLNMIASAAPTVKRIRTLKELHHEFFLCEQNAFDLRMESSLPILLSRKDSQESQLIMTLASQRLVSVIPAMLRFSTVNIITSSDNASIAGRFSKVFEKDLQEYLMKQRQNDSNYIDEEAGEVSIIVIDRTIDSVTPLLHDYSYQSMIYDLLEVDTTTNIVEYEKVEKDDSGEGNSGASVKHIKQQLSDVKDEVFAKYRYRSITSSLSGIKEDFESHTALMQKTRAKDGSGGAPRSIEDVQKIINNYPQYKELLSKYAMHFDLILRCYNRFTRWGLQEVCEIEQSLVTGVDDEAKKISAEKFFAKIEEILTRKEGINTSDKSRIALIAYLTLDLSVEQREKIKKTCDVVQQKMLRNLSWLGNLFTDESKSFKDKSWSKVSSKLVELTMQKYSEYKKKNDICVACKQVQAENKKKPKSDRGVNKDCDECGKAYFEFSVMRHTPLSVLAVNSVVKLVEDTYAGIERASEGLERLGFTVKSLNTGSNKQGVKLPQQERRVEIEMTNEQTTSKKATKSKKKKGEEEMGQPVLGDLRKANEYDKLLREKENTDEDDSDQFKKQKKFIVFFLGGVSFAEIRTLRAFQQLSFPKTPIIIGSTHILTPQSYLKALEDMHSFG